MRRRPWLEIGLLIAVIALVGFWAFPFRNEPAHPEVQWQATWEDELVFDGVSGQGTYYSETLYAERDRFRLVGQSLNGLSNSLVGAGALRRRGDRLELQGMGNSPRYRIHSRAGHLLLESLDAITEGFEQRTMSEPHLRPASDWLRPGGRFGVLGVSPGTAVSDVRRRLGEPDADCLPGIPPSLLAFPVKRTHSVLVLEPDRNGCVSWVYGARLEQDGRPLLNSRSTLVDLESLFGPLPAPVDTDVQMSRYDWPRLGLSVVVSQFPSRTPTRDDAEIAAIRLSPPR